MGVKNKEKLDIKDKEAQLMDLINRVGDRGFTHLYKLCKESGLFTSRETLSEYLSRLQWKGLISAQKEEKPERGKPSRYSLTEKGLHVLQTRQVAFSIVKDVDDLIASTISGSNVNVTFLFNSERLRAIVLTFSGGVQKKLFELFGGAPAIELYRKKSILPPESSRLAEALARGLNTVLLNVLVENLGPTIVLGDDTISLGTDLEEPLKKILEEDMLSLKLIIKNFEKLKPQLERILKGLSF